MTLVSCLIASIPLLTVNGSIRLESDEIKFSDLLSASLKIEANVYYGDQDEEIAPVTETDFFMLDQSFMDILKNSKFNPEFEGGKEREIVGEDYLTATAKALSSGDEESTIVSYFIKKEIFKHRLFVLKTNFRGQAEVKRVKTGNYYLFGIGKSGDEIFVWHFPVKIKSGRNVIEVDQNNAAVIFSAD